jgi:SRSO17 transposase
MYSGMLGKVGSCQIGVSVHAVTDRASAAIGWQLFLPKSWDDATTTDADTVRTRRRDGRSVSRLNASGVDGGVRSLGR